MRDKVLRVLEESASLKRTVAENSADTIVRVAEEIALCIKNGGKVLIFGNGGSAADAQHIASELVGRLSGLDRRPLAALALTTDSSALTAIGNDFGFEVVFERQVAALGAKGDVVIGISTSGSSKNVIRAVKKATEMEIKTVVLTGCDGGELGAIAMYHINVPAKSTPRVQEAHITIGHIICELVEEDIVAMSRNGGG